MTEFHVAWRITEDAASPREAAEAVRARYFKLTEATVYEVQPLNDDLKCRTDLVDLTYPDEDRVEHKYTPQVLHRMAEKIIADGGDLDTVLEMLEKPFKWPEVLTQVLLDAEFDKVSPVPDTPDKTTDPEPEPDPVLCMHCEADLRCDDKGALATGYWYSTDSMSAICRKSPSGYHDPAPKE